MERAVLVRSGLLSPSCESALSLYTGRCSCGDAENELKVVQQEKSRLSIQLSTYSQKVAEYDQVKSDYVQLRETLDIVTQDRNSALQEKKQLHVKLENLEQVLKHMREAAERRQQLELEHEHALAVLNAKQQEIDLLQKAQVEAKKEHEGAVQLLENTLDSMQAKVRELEEKCRSQSEQFNLLSKELEKFRLQAGTFDLLSTNPLAVCDTPGTPTKSLSQLLNGLATPIGKGNESPANRNIISEFIQPIQISGDKPELLSVKPTFLTRTRTSSPHRAFLAEMDNELSSTTSKARYTGKVRLCIARYSYNPYDGPNENPEAELPLVAGKYLYVYGNMDEDGFYEGELLDGQRGLVPSNFVDFVQDEEMPSVHTVDSGKEQGYLNHTGQASSGILPDSKFDGSLTGDITSSCSNGTGTLDVSIDEIGEDIVPYPRKINLIKQLAKSVIVGWEPPVVPPGWGPISGYNVLVDKEVRVSVPFGGRTKSLIEKLNLATCTYRISIQSITEKGLSDELRCTLLVGKDVVVAPFYLRVDNIMQTSAELSWLPSNSNYSHTIFLNDVEYDMVKAACYKYQFFQLKPNMVYKVKAVAQPHQMPWQLPLEQREKREASVEFCTQPAGPPAAPQEVQIECGSAPGVIQVRWKPPPLSPNGTSNGANVVGYAVCTKGQKIAEVLYPTADYVTVELTRIQCLEAREVIVRTLSAQGESQDSPVAVIPHNLLVPPPPQPHPAPKPKPLASAREPETKEEPGAAPSARLSEPWEPARSPSPSPLLHGRSLEPPAPHFHSPAPGRRSPSPQRILPQPQGEPIPNTVAKAIAREAAQRVAAESSRYCHSMLSGKFKHTVASVFTSMEKRNIFSERSSTIHPLNSDEDEDGYESPHVKRRGASVDEFLRGSELGRQPLYSHSEDYQTESSRGSDLSDIMEEDEEDLYSEMQLEEGGRRRNITSHNTLKASCKRNNISEEDWDLLWESSPQKQLCNKKLFSIPEVAEEDFDTGEMTQRLRLDEGQGVFRGTPNELKSTMQGRCRTSTKVYYQDIRKQYFLSPSKRSILLKQRSGRSMEDCPVLEDRGCSRLSRQVTRSPDSGLDCGSEEEEARSLTYRNHCHTSPLRASPGPNVNSNCDVGPESRVPTQSTGRKRTLTRQSIVEEDFCDIPSVPGSHEAVMLILFFCFKILGNPSSTGRSDRLDHSGRRLSHGCGAQQRPRPMMVPSIEITMDSNSEGGRSRSGSEGNLSPLKEDVYYRSVAGRKKWPLQRSMASQHRYVSFNSAVKQQCMFVLVFSSSSSHACYLGFLSSVYISYTFSLVFSTCNSYSMRAALKIPVTTCICEAVLTVAVICIYGYDRREQPSPEYYEDSEPEDMSRIFVALFDYDPLSMSPNPDAADEELPFKEGQIIKVYGDKDTDGFYRGEICGRSGLIPCNMVSEIQTDDEEMMEQLIKQGFLPLNTPVEKIACLSCAVNCDRFKDGARSVNRRSRKSKRERNRRSGRQHSVPTRRMVALYDYDPRESSPNVDVEAELTFCAGDIITVFGEIDEDGFYYGEINGHKGLVPSNFLEEVPDDVEVYLTDTPSRYAQDTPVRTKTKRV
ncbi:RIMB2 protein, partial [Atractosteus spatula]|nr:RIMB2 protein [Atractosteus spatula]